MSSAAPNAASAREGAIDTVAMLAEEAAAVHGRPLAGNQNQYVALNQLNSAALCLSGGGIRSASFALGVIQALASHRLPATASQPAEAKDSLLAQFHYLSTVSGGGYCGSWLSAWRHRQDFPTIWAALVGRPAGPDNEPKPIGWLRENSNYLTPKLGLTSADTWSALTIMVRNLILNWLVILPVVVLTVLFLKAVLTWAGYMAAFGHDVRWPSIVLVIAGALLLISALRFATRNRPTRRTQVSDQREFFLRYALPAIASAFMISLAAVTASADMFVGRIALAWLIVIGAAFGFLVYLVSWLIARPQQRDAADLALWAASGAVYGIFLALGAALYHQAVGMPLPEACSATSSILSAFHLPVILLLVFGTPWVVVSQLIAEMLFIGLSSYESESDGDREWFARAGGFLLSFSLAWIIFMILILVGSDLVCAAVPKVKSAILAAGGLSGLVTAVLGKSRFTPAKGQAKGPAAVSANLIAGIAASIFAITLLIGISWLLDQVMFGRGLASTDFMRPHQAVQGLPDFPREFWCIVLAAIVAGAVGAAASKSVNINRFSLHALYRNRLIRAYLGASNRTEDEYYPPDINPFTKFAQSDNVRVHDLWSAPAGGKATVGTNDWRPFHVLNMTLNIASTKRLAWQERKAETFTVTPLHSGSTCKAFRSSRTYGDPKGISLGTAVAISGAAASPNMGYHSSAPLSLLLAFFNVRLGWWLGNPGDEGRRTYSHEGPETAIGPFLKEVFGQTTDSYKYIYLSDGGHFDNLGLYEMVRRRCRVIVVSDAAADEAYAFADLGNAVRKIAIDLGVSITFPEGGLQKLRRRPADGPDLGTITGPDAPLRYAVGIIHYSQADGSDSKDGVLLYIKPSYFGSEGAGVRNYASTHPQFPHEGTLDQWFSESQLESYRALGFEIMDGVLARAAAALPQPTSEFGDLFRALLR